jgi:hypothetical protein
MANEWLRYQADDQPQRKSEKQCEWGDSSWHRAELSPHRIECQFGRGSLNHQRQIATGVA